ncbi:MAG: hypothetical protein GY822_13315 [Deltaproteobacteria bacterium]|nr:hypothetical protein [Deltaproteobacteria bacterium]
MSSIQRQNRSSTLARQQTAGTRTSVGDAPVTQRVAQQNPAPTTQTPGPSHGSNAHLGQANQEASVRLQTPSQHSSLPMSIRLGAMTFDAPLKLSARRNKKRWPIFTSTTMQLPLS